MQPLTILKDCLKMIHQEEKIMRDHSRDTGTTWWLPDRSRYFYLFSDRPGKTPGDPDPES